ncbi:85/88 kDa calcium-independent phospholipase A2-like [Hetaerina americana]|uniref:85/88 kDa calcium-independent phospholipase A2-like n=1 Tax=Hetaerina americana TaxID=62018 RepID=UPI003A7F2362
MTANVHIELGNEKLDFQFVKHSWSVGGKSYVTVPITEPTLLHYIYDVDIARMLLLQGAQVDGQDVKGCTPLMNAVVNCKRVEFFRELLKHGADVNKQNWEGDTALHIAVRNRHFSYTGSIIKELLEHGADINIRNMFCSMPCFPDRRDSPLDNAVNNPQCAKLLIKVTLLKNFDKNFRKIINLTPYKALATFNEFTNFIKVCVHEVTQMKADKINESLSLYEFMITKNLSKEVMFSTKRGFKNINDEVLSILSSSNYHVYHEIILDKITFYLRDVSNESLCNGLKMYTESDVSDEGLTGRRVVLDSYSAHGVVKYLSKGDVLNLLIAFREGQSSGFVNSPVEFKQPSRLNNTATQCHTKQKRLKKNFPSF